MFALVDAVRGDAGIADCNRDSIAPHARSKERGLLRRAAALSYGSAWPQRGERLVLRLFAPVGTAIATLIALIKQFDPLEFLGAFLKRDPRIAKLRLKLVD
jgi:hypothetical protein